MFCDFRDCALNTGEAFDFGVKLHCNRQESGVEETNIAAICLNSGHRIGQQRPHPVGLDLHFL